MPGILPLLHAPEGTTEEQAREFVAGQLNAGDQGGYTTSFADTVPRAESQSDSLATGFETSAQLLPLVIIASLGAIGIYSIVKIPNKDKNFHYAGFLMRCAAGLIDVAIIAVAAVPIYIIVSLVGVIMLGSAPAHEIKETVNSVESLLGLLVVWVYFAEMESSKLQATLGKRLLGLRVVDLNGKKISFGKATGRHFGKMISVLTFFIGHFMMGWTKRKQGLHDKMAGCLVVRRSEQMADMG